MRACLDLHGRADAGRELPGRWQLLSPLGVVDAEGKVRSHCGHVGSESAATSSLASFKTASLPSRLPAWHTILAAESRSSCFMDGSSAVSASCRYLAGWSRR